MRCALLQSDSRHALSTKTDGVTQMFGRILAAWVFVIGAAFVLSGAYVSLEGVDPMGNVMRDMHSEPGAR